MVELKSTLGFLHKLRDVFGYLLIDAHIEFDDAELKIITSDKRVLLRLNDQQLIAADMDVLPVLYKFPSPEADFFLELNLLEKFISVLQKRKAVIRLNHVGFCYKVESQQKERLRLNQEIRRRGWKFYEMPSTDASLWLFVGDTHNWSDSMIELLPVETTTDTEAKWWLPHVHIDFDTTLSEEGIDQVVTKVFLGKRKAIRTAIIDGVVYQVRIWLGIINGINIDLDLATNKRDTKWGRLHYMKEVLDY